MSRHAWRHLQQLQEAGRDGMNRLSNSRRDSLSSFGGEAAMDIVFLVIGALIYIQFDFRPIVAITLPELLATYQPLWAMVGLALAAFGGIRLGAALIEMGGWMIGGWVKRLLKKNQ